MKDVFIMIGMVVGLIILIIIGIVLLELFI